VSTLSKKQIQGIFSGKITNWKDAGGKDQAITVINRPASSGTRAVFVKTLMGTTELSKDTLTEDATGTVVQKVKQTAGAVSYAAFSGTHNQSGINEVSIDGNAPTDETIESGKYPFWSYEHIYTNGPPSSDVSRFIAFIQSNSTLLHKTGYILVRDMKVSESDR
jgi:phosphate transport system substrate-binding protein